MARTIDTIIFQLKKDIVNNRPLLSGLSNILPTTVYYNLIVVIATGIYYFDLLIDAYKQDIENAIKNHNGTKEYVTTRIFEYQYGDELVINSDRSVHYATIDTSKRVVSSVIIPITSASAGWFDSAGVGVVVAKGTPPSSLSASELNGLIGYMSHIRPFLTITTADSDNITITATITIDMQYYDVIRTTLYAAMTDYLYKLPNGVFNISTLIKVMLGVTGVNTVYIDIIKVRTAVQAWAAGTVLYKHDYGGNAIGSLDADYQSTNGALIQETTSTHTWDDTITIA